MRCSTSTSCLSWVEVAVALSCLDRAQQPTWLLSGTHCEVLRRSSTSNATRPWSIAQLYFNFIESVPRTRPDADRQSHSPIKMAVSSDSL